jgi:hypothetical protein
MVVIGVADYACLGVRAVPSEQYCATAFSFSCSAQATKRWEART